MTLLVDGMLGIIEKLKIGYKLPSCKKLGVSQRTRARCLQKLVSDGIIIYKGNGVWEILVSESRLKEYVCKLKEDAITKSYRRVDPKGSPLKDVRAHGYRAVREIPYLKNWDRREEYLIKNKIPYVALKGSGKRYRIEVCGHKVWLCPTKIVVIFSKDKSFLNATAKEGKNQAVYEIERINKRVENLLNISLSKFYTYKIIRQHYAKVDDELAKEYTRNHKKLIIKDSRGRIRIIADKSFEDELETVGSPSQEVDSDKDMDVVVKPFFQDLLDEFDRTGEIPRLTEFNNKIKLLLDSHDKLVKAQLNLTENVNKYVQATTPCPNIEPMGKPSKNERPDYFG